jgi:hypothetical protein
MQVSRRSVLVSAGISPSLLRGCRIAQFAKDSGESREGFAHAFAACGIVPASLGDVAIQDLDRRTPGGACRVN